MQDPYWQRNIVLIIEGIATFGIPGLFSKADIGPATNSL